MTDGAQRYRVARACEAYLGAVHDPATPEAVLDGCLADIRDAVQAVPAARQLTVAACGTCRVSGRRLHVDEGCLLHRH